MSLSNLYFRVITDRSKTIGFEEFKKGISDFGISLNEDEAKQAFQTFDVDESGSINFNEFLVKLRPALNNTRRSIIEQAFDKFDKTDDGKVTVADVKGVYNAKHHPKYENGEWTETQVER